MIIGISIEHWQAPEVVKVENTINGLQKAVDGYFTILHWKDDIVMVIDEEAALLNKPQNFYFITPSGAKQWIRGTAFFCRMVNDDLVSLTKDQLIEVNTYFHDKRY